MPRWDFEHDGISFGLLHPKPFNASRGTVLSYSETTNPGSLPELTLRGMVIGSITEVMDLMCADDFIRAPNPALKFVAKIMECGPPDLRSRLYLDGFIASTADRTMDDSRARESIAQRAKDCGDYLRWWQEGDESTIMQAQDLLGRATKALPGGAYFECLRTICNGRRYFFTKASFGIAPALAQEGDLICILLGGNVPYVLRKTGDKYLLTGDCYLHGYMDGEAVTKQKISGLDIVDFKML